MKKTLFILPVFVLILFFGCATTLPTDDGPDFYGVSSSLLADTAAAARTDVFLHVPYEELVFEMGTNSKERLADWYIEGVLSYKGEVKATVLGEQIEEIPYGSRDDESTKLVSMYRLSFKGTPGWYKLLITATDRSTGKSQKRDYDIRLRSISPNSFNISDPVFLGDAVRGNDREMAAFADPQKIDHQKPIAFAFELYTKMPGNVDIAVNYKIKDKGKDFLSYSDTLRNISVPEEGKLITVVRTIPDTLSSDNCYLFELFVDNLTSGAKSDTVQKEIAFAGAWPNSQEEMKMAFGALEYLAPLAKATIDEAKTKKEKLAIFYRAILKGDYGLRERGIDAREYMRRLNHANSEYSTFRKRDGWKKPQGRIYIKFGLPDTFFHYPANGSRMYNYIVWYYSARPASNYRERLFVFVNKYGDEYALDYYPRYLPEIGPYRFSDLNNEF